MGSNTRKWTKEEDEIAMRMMPIEAARILTHRTRGAIAAHRQNLRIGAELAKNKSRFTVDEIELLRRLWPTARRTTDLVKHFPGRTALQLGGAAHTRRMRRIYLGDDFARVDGHMELIDIIKIRAKQDGLTFIALDRQLGTGKYFQSGAYYRKKINMGFVAKAVEFFGGTFMIDWQDRDRANPPPASTVVRMIRSARPSTDGRTYEGRRRLRSA